MTNNLTTFNFGSNEVRTITINSEPWFVAKDICSILEHTNPSMVCGRLDADEKLVSAMFISGQTRDMSLVNESGLYSLIMTSRKPEAKAFKKWVTSEVLPAIRKTGTYSVQPAPAYNHKDFLPSPAMEAVQVGTMLADVLNLHGTSRTAMINDALKIKAPEYLSLMPAYATNAPRTMSGKLLGGEGNSLPAFAATSLLKKFNSISTITFNKLAEEYGFLETRERPSSRHENVAKTYKAITNKGLEFGYNLSNEFSKGSVSPVWFESKFPELLDIICY